MHRKEIVLSSPTLCLAPWYDQTPQPSLNHMRTSHLGDLLNSSSVASNLCFIPQPIGQCPIPQPTAQLDWKRSMEWTFLWASCLATGPLLCVSPAFVGLRDSGISTLHVLGTLRHHTGCQEQGEGGTGRPCCCQSLSLELMAQKACSC